jgi:hypothetical protein
MTMALFSQITLHDGGLCRVSLGESPFQNRLDALKNVRKIFPKKHAPFFRKILRKKSGASIWDF